MMAGNGGADVSLDGMRSQGIVFDDTSLSFLRALDEGAQNAILQRTQEYLRNPSALLTHLIQHDQAQCQGPSTEAARVDAPVAAQVQSLSILDEGSAAPGHIRGESLPLEKLLESQWLDESQLIQAADTLLSDETVRRQCSSAALLPAGSHMLNQSQTSGMPPSQYVMCQQDLDIFRSSRVASSCMRGATEAHEVDHALTLCSSDLAYLTVCRVRDVESFPWKLPCGWYALHVAQRDLTEPLRDKVANTGTTIPTNLPTDCIVGVIKLGFSKPSWHFDGDPWASGQFCQAVEDVVMLQSCVPTSTEELRRLWILPDEVRAKVQSGTPVDLHKEKKALVTHAALGVPGAGSASSSFASNAVNMLVVQQTGVSADPAELLALSTPLRSTNGGVLDQAASCKRPRLHPLSHAAFPQQAPPDTDRLKHLYPHPRDKDCYLDDKLHQYCVHGKPYNLSVSGWWKMFFEDFDSKKVSEGIIRRHSDIPGFRLSRSGKPCESILVTSVYNFAQHIRVFERHDDDYFIEALRVVSLAAKADYTSRGERFPFAIERVVALGREFLADPQKPEGPSCYYLMFLHTASCGRKVQAAQLAQTWDIHGSLESLKGTYLHKKIELFVNAMARPMERDRTLLVAVEDLLKEHPCEQEYSGEAVFRQIAWAQDPELWNHPLAQRFFEKEVCGESLEFGKFRAWLATHPRWTPLRLEWSLYNEDLKVAGQIDSLWLDLDNGGTFVIADWKRAREFLTNDPIMLESASFGKKGTQCCSHLYDTAWSHYFVQQTLYAYLLASKYGLVVRKMMLVQCHPHVCGADFNEAPLVADFEMAENLAKFLMNRAAPTF